MAKHFAALGQIVQKLICGARLEPLSLHWRSKAISPPAWIPPQPWQVRAYVGRTLRGSLCQRRRARRGAPL